MTQDERRRCLIDALLAERADGKGIEVPSSADGQRVLLRALMNVRPPAPVAAEVLAVQDAYLAERLRERGGAVDAAALPPVDAADPVLSRVALWRGDITLLAADAVVNAANSQMLGCFVPGHHCIDNAIHTFAGMQLRLDCARLMAEQGHAEPTGQVEEQVRRMVAEQRDMRVPAGLVPRCPVCGTPMAMNLRADDTFVEDEGWHAAAARYHAFVRRHRRSRLLLLELGVGGNTPVIIKLPFWRMAAENPRATYACVNLGEAVAPSEIAGRSALLNKSAADVVDALAGVVATA